MFLILTSVQVFVAELELCIIAYHVQFYEVPTHTYFLFSLFCVLRVLWQWDKILMRSWICLLALSRFIPSLWEIWILTVRILNALSLLLRGLVENRLLLQKVLQQLAWLQVQMILVWVPNTSNRFSSDMTAVWPMIYPWVSFLISFWLPQQSHNYMYMIQIKCM